MGAGREEDEDDQYEIVDLESQDFDDIDTLAQKLMSEPKKENRDLEKLRRDLER